MNIRPANNEGPIAMRRIIIKPRPGSNNVVSTIRDGIHCRSNRGPMLIEECYFESMMDDSINIFSLGYACGKLTDDGGLFIQRAGGGEPIDSFRPGDKVVLLDRTSGNYLAEMTVKRSIPQFKNTNDMEKTNRFFTLYFQEKLPSGIVFGKPNGQRATEVYNLSACGAGSVVRKNTFMPQRRHALLFSSPNTAFIDNIVDGVHGSAVYGSTQGHYICGPIPAGAIVKNNKIKNTGREAIKFYTHATVGGKHDLSKSPAKNFLISGNSIEYRYNDAIKLINVNGVLIENNKLAASKVVTPAAKPINLINCITQRKK